jgi:hypothetical protein
MSWLSRVLNVVRRGRLNRELDEEIEFHLAARTEELIGGGMTPDQAREQARPQFGSSGCQPLRMGIIRRFYLDTDRADTWTTRRRIRASLSARLPTIPRDHGHSLGRRAGLRVARLATGLAVGGDCQ